MMYHPVDFDIDDFLSRIQGNKPPFMCPAETCGKIYKSYAHMQKHMLIHRPPAPIEIPAPQLDCTTNADALAISGQLSLPSYLLSTPLLQNDKLSTQKPTSLLAPTDSRCSVVFEATPTTGGQTFRCSIFVPLTFRIQSFASDNIKMRNTAFSHHHHPQLESCGDCGSERKVQPSKNKSKIKNSSKKSGNRDERLSINSDPLRCNASTNLANPEERKTEIQLPKPVFEIDPDFLFKKPVPLKEALGYIRFIEKSPDELDDIVEYDLDEEVSPSNEFL
ncbi:unnamed protein product [Echinostoma caproni]|uniref:C2H2-type domain-containing protein n=1 Tax=Echinostoma caproni TaxID=27848 RepID=A0A183AWB2_9TREM|nr:unnamed protein product [Echinostoma caproni]